MDNDQPDETSILAVRDTIIEGETALFEISIPIVQSIEQMLTISVSQNGEFLKSSEESRTVVMEPYQTSVLFEVPTIDDLVDESNGQIQVSLSNSSEISDSRIFESAVVAIVDNDKPTVSITPVATSVVEGSIAEFRVFSPIAPIETTVIYVMVSQLGEVINEAPGMKEVVLLPGETSSILQVKTSDDQVYDDQGVIIATLVAGDTYNTVENAHETRVEVTENDHLPVLSIATDSANLEEGDDLGLIITASSKSWDAKEVAVNITDHDSNFLPLALPTSITLAPQSLTTRFEISTIDDEVFESDGANYCVHSIRNWI